MSEKQGRELPPGIKIANGRYHLRFMVSGVEYNQTTGLKATSHNLSAALRKLEQARQAVESGSSLPKLSPRQFNNAFAVYLEHKRGECKDHPATAKRIRTSSASLIDFFQGTMVHSITSGMVEDFKDYRRASKIKDITIRHDLHALSGFFKYARKQGWLRGNPLDGVTIPSADGVQREHVVTPQEELIYFAAAATRPVLHDLGRVVLGTGMRPEEVLDLHPQDVNLDANSVTVRKGKSNAAKRTIGMSEEAREVLARRMAGKRLDARLFVGKRGSVGDNLLNSLDKTHLKLVKKLKLHFVIYELRHTFATRLAMRGCPLPTLAAILGHGNLASLRRYVHVQQASISEWSGIRGEKRHEKRPTPPSKTGDLGTSPDFGPLQGTKDELQ